MANANIAFDHHSGLLHAIARQDGRLPSVHERADRRTQAPNRQRRSCASRASSVFLRDSSTMRWMAQCQCRQTQRVDVLHHGHAQSVRPWSRSACATQLRILYAEVQTPARATLRSSRSHQLDGLMPQLRRVLVDFLAISDLQGKCSAVHSTRAHSKSIPLAGSIPNIPGIGIHQGHALVQAAP
jgi:hypothetical protein